MMGAGTLAGVTAQDNAAAGHFLNAPATFATGSSLTGSPVQPGVTATPVLAYTSYAQFAALSSLPDAPETPPKALDMVRVLVAGHEAVARTARKLFPIADKAGDEPTADLLTQRLTVHEQTAWMLRSLLEE